MAGLRDCKFVLCLLRKQGEPAHQLPAPGNRLHGMLALNSSPALLCVPAYGAADSSVSSKTACASLGFMRAFVSHTWMARLCHGSLTWGGARRLGVQLHCSTTQQLLGQPQTLLTAIKMSIRGPSKHLQPRPEHLGPTAVLWTAGLQLREDKALQLCKASLSNPAQLGETWRRALIRGPCIPSS